jgi:hypothetical protein
MQPLVIETGGTRLRQMTPPEDGIVPAVLSGNGRVARASAPVNQLLRIALNGDPGVEEILPATPALTGHTILGLSPGSLLTLVPWETTMTGTVPLSGESEDSHSPLEGLGADAIVRERAPKVISIRSED